MRRAHSAVSIAILFASVSASASEFWIHVEIQNDEDSRVEINLPFDRLGDRLPGLFDNAHCRIDVGTDGITTAELRRALESSAPGSVQTESDSRVVGHRENGELVVSDRADSETTVRMPIWLAEALLSGGSTELNLAAAVRAVRQNGGGSLAIRTEDGERVRIWVDRRPER